MRVFFFGLYAGWLLEIDFCTRIHGRIPLSRYFFFVGSLIIGLFFFADHYLQSSPTQLSARDARDVDKSIIGIQSAQRPPERIIFDTTMAFVPPPTRAVVAELPSTTASSEKSPPRESFALMTAPKVAPAKRTQTTSRVIKRPQVTRLAASPTETPRQVAEWLVTPGAPGRRAAFSRKREG